MAIYGLLNEVCQSSSAKNYESPTCAVNQILNPKLGIRFTRDLPTSLNLSYKQNLITNLHKR